MAHLYIRWLGEPVQALVAANGQDPAFLKWPNEADERRLEPWFWADENGFAVGAAAKHLNAATVKLSLGPSLNEPVQGWSGRDRLAGFVRRALVLAERQVNEPVEHLTCLTPAGLAPSVLADLCRGATLAAAAGKLAIAIDLVAFVDALDGTDEATRTLECWCDIGRLTVIEAGQVRVVETPSLSLVALTEALATRIAADSPTFAALAQPLRKEAMESLVEMWPQASQAGRRGARVLSARQRAAPLALYVPGACFEAVEQQVVETLRTILGEAPQSNAQVVVLGAGARIVGPLLSQLNWRGRILGAGDEFDVLLERQARKPLAGSVATLSEDIVLRPPLFGGFRDAPAPQILIKRDARLPYTHANEVFERGRYGESVEIIMSSADGSATLLTKLKFPDSADLLNHCRLQVVVHAEIDGEILLETSVADRRRRNIAFIHAASATRQPVDTKIFEALERHR